MADYLVRNEGSIVQFVPQNEDAQNFLNENVGFEHWQIFGESLCVDHNSAEGLIGFLLGYGYDIEEA
jgi:hypothetical protein